MPEPIGVEIILDKPRHLLYTLNEIIDLSEALNVSPDQFDAELPKAVQANFRNIRKIVWLGLRTDDPDLTEEAAGRLIDVRNLPELMAKMSEALETRVGAKETRGTPAPPKVTGQRKS